MRVRSRARPTELVAQHALFLGRARLCDPTEACSSWTDVASLFGFPCRQESCRWVVEAQPRLDSSAVLAHRSMGDTMSHTAAAKQKRCLRTQVLAGDLILSVLLITLSVLPPLPVVPVSIFIVVAVAVVVVAVPAVSAVVVLVVVVVVGGASQVSSARMAWHPRPPCV